MNTFTTLAYYYSTSRRTYDDADLAGLGVIFTFFIMFAILGAILGYVATSIPLMKIFQKAGINGGYAWVPFLNSWKLLEIGGQQGFWAILAIIPIVSIVSAVFAAISMYNIGLKLGKTGGFVALGIFLPIVWLYWLAFDKSKWNSSVGAPSLASEHHTQPTPPAAAA